MKHSSRFLLLGLVLTLAACAPSAPPPAQNASTVPALPSWSGGPARAAIVAFVERVTDESGPDFVPVADRIAVFDNDGTLWAEQPAYFQLFYGLDKMRVAAEADPALAAQEPYRTLLDQGTAGLAGMDVHALLGPLVGALAGSSTDAFVEDARAWLATARHPDKRVPYTDLVYQPMLELLDYLRAHGFETWICSGGGIDFVRAFSADVYGIPAEQVIGTSLKMTLDDAGSDVVREAEIDRINDGPGKPVGIALHIGKRPILAFGNSDGDLEMLRYATAGPGPSLGLLLHHDDAEREWAYDRDSSVGRLGRGFDLASQYGWMPVSMKDEWSTVFPSR